MNQLNNTEMLLFLNKRPVCKHVVDNEFAFDCRKINRNCNFDNCPILEKCTDIEQFIEEIERQ